MPTRILPVRDAQGDPYPLAGQGIQATATLDVEAATTATATLSRTGAATATTTAATTATAVLDRVATATRTVTATITASATTASPTDISSLITEGSGTYGAGTLTIPASDGAYVATVEDDLFPVSPTGTRGVRVLFPTPGTPNATHTVVVTWTIADRTRRVFHDLDNTAWWVTGQIVEPLSTAGSTATLTYSWDVAAQGWYVSDYTGDTLVREHGPSESTGTVPLFFTPEARALGTFADIRTGHLSALSALPSSVASHLAGSGVVVDIDSGGSDHLFETMYSRQILDPSWQSGAFGFFGQPTTNAYPWLVTNGTCDGRVMLHELGHAWDRHALSLIDATFGVDPSGIASPNATDTVTAYYDTGEVWIVANFYPTYLTWVEYSKAGAEIGGGYGERDQYALFRNEQTIVDLYATVPDKSGNYYRSLLAEWVAQCFGLLWMEQVSGYNSSEWSALVSDIGGASLLADFKAHAVSLGVHPSSW